MTMQTTEFAPAHRGVIGSLASRLWQAFIAFGERNSRRDQVLAMEAKSDAELAEMGVSRDRIVQYVFRDKLL